MTKIKLLVLDVANAGVGKYRFRDPHKMLQKLYLEDFHVDIMANPPLQDKNFVSQYDAIFLQGSILMKDDAFKLFEQLKKDGMKIIVDLDDYWRLPFSHAMHKKMEKLWKTLVQRLKIADLVTTTTKFLAHKIARYAKRVVIIPNAINPKEKQFQSNPTESDKLRIGWAGGSSHQEDLKLVRGLANHMFRFKEKDMQLVMCGFNNLSRDIETGETSKVKFPKVWMECEYIFTGGYFNMDDNYKHYLLHPSEEQYPTADDQLYKRIWTKPIQTYGTAYNEFDIAIAPLVDNEFNRMKSQLKVIEAGFHKKPLIISDIAPYQIDCVHEKNALLVPQKKAHKLFTKYAKKLAKEDNLRQDLGEALYETVKDRYDLNKVTKRRAQIYKSLF